MSKISYKLINSRTKPTINKTIAEKRYGELFCEFQIDKSILASHFKLLMGLAKQYDKYTKIGYITKNQKQQFLDLCVEIENSNDEEAIQSHERSQKKPQKKKEIICDHADLGSFGYVHGQKVTCPNCNKPAIVW